MSGEREFLTTDEVADWLRRPPATLRSWRCRGLGPPAVKIGGKIVYRPSDVRQWIDQQNPGPES